MSQSPPSYFRIDIFSLSVLTLIILYIIKKRYIYWTIKDKIIKKIKET